MQLSPDKVQGLKIWCINSMWTTSFSLQHYLMIYILRPAAVELSTQTETDAVEFWTQNETRAG